MAEEIGDPAAGYSLSPPEGWKAALQEGRAVMAPAGGGAAMMAIPHAASGADELAPLLEQGWTEPGLELAPSGPPENAQGSVSVEMAGRADGQDARGSMLVLFGPHGGGLILLGVVPSADERDPGTLVRGVAETVRFSEPETEALVQGWDDRLRGRKLSYFYSYASGPAVEGLSPGGGIQERHEVALHPDGRFEQEGEFVASLGEAGGAAQRVEPPSGEWRIVAVAGQALLELGAEGYVLSEEGGEIFLNGRRYFVT